MFTHPLAQALSLAWKLLTVLIIPLIMIAYVKAINGVYGDFTFSDLDQGKNLHKWAVLAAYLAFLLCWNRVNPFVISVLKKLEH